MCLVNLITKLFVKHAKEQILITCSKMNYYDKIYCKNLLSLKIMHVLNYTKHV